MEDPGTPTSGPSLRPASVEVSFSFWFAFFTEPKGTVHTETTPNVREEYADVFCKLMPDLATLQLEHCGDVMAEFPRPERTQPLGDPFLGSQPSG